MIDPPLRPQDAAGLGSGREWIGPKRPADPIFEFNATSVGVGLA
jgi:hypothetical protein